MGGSNTNTHSQIPFFVTCSPLHGQSNYQAATHGLKPEIVFVMNKYDYEGEKQVEFEEKPTT